MSLTEIEITANDVAAAKELASKAWHNLSRDEVAQVIALEAIGLLASAVREPGGDNGYLRCEVGAYTGPQ